MHIFTHTLQASLSGPLPPNSATIGYATEGALLTSSMHLSTDAVNTLQKVWTGSNIVS